MAIPPRDIFDTPPLLDLDPDDDVLQDLIQGMADMKRAVRVRRTIVKDELVMGRSIGSLPSVECLGASLQVLLFLRRRPDSGSSSGQSPHADFAPLGRTYGNDDLGNLNVDVQDFDISPTSRGLTSSS